MKSNNLQILPDYYQQYKIGKLYQFSQPLIILNGQPMPIILWESNKWPINIKHPKLKSQCIPSSFHELYLNDIFIFLKFSSIESPSLDFKIITQYPGFKVLFENKILYLDISNPKINLNLPDPNCTFKEINL